MPSYAKISQNLNWLCTYMPVEDMIKPPMSYADVTKGKRKFVTWKSELAKEATKQHDKQLLEEVQGDLIK